MFFGIPVNTGRRTLSRPLIIFVLCFYGLLHSAAAVQAEQAPLTLTDAVARTLAQNPGLQVFDFRLRGLGGLRDSADLNPALELGLEVENFLGSDERQGFDSAEYTLSLSSVLELGGKRAARTGVIASRYGLVAAERRARTLDLLGEVTQGFVAALALQEKLKLAADSVKLAEATRDTVARRARRGATPEAEVLRANAALAQSRIEYERIEVELQGRKMALAALWGGEHPDFTLAGDLYRFGTADGFEALFQRVSESPAIRVYASEQRMRDAEVQLARSQAASDISWQVGIRHYGESDDAALVAGVSAPLFSGRRNRGDVQAALAARDEVEFQRADALLALRVRLFEAWQLRQHSIETVERMRDRILPDLTQALDQTRDAYEHGRYSYVEWTAAQRELIAARLALVDAATTALLNQALIEQLTAEPLATMSLPSAR